MSQHGRGCLEIRPDNHPQYESETRRTHSYLQVREKLEASGYDIKEPEKPKHALAFMYETSSQSYGVDCPNSGSKLAKAMDLRLPRFQPKAKTAEDVMPQQVDDGTTRTKEQCQQLAQSWEQNSVRQHPMYATSASIIGMKAPSANTVNEKHCPNENKFTNTFNGIRYRDQGLNTSVSKNRVHDALSY